jgi:hypothetical protein
MNEGRRGEGRQGDFIRDNFFEMGEMDLFNLRNRTWIFNSIYWNNRTKEH